MFWVWVVALLGLLALVGIGIYLRGRPGQSSSHRTSGERSTQPYNPSIFVDMDDKPPMEIDFDAGIQANQRVLPKNPSKDESS